MWHSYHGSSVVEQGVPEKYLIGEVKGFKEFYSYDGDFYSKLKKNVEKLIPKNRKQNEFLIVFKSIILLAFFFYSIYKYVTDCTVLSAIL